MGLKLQQGQLWKKGDTYIRIKHLERLEVEYKTFKATDALEAHQHFHATKKEFCRLLKGAELIPPAHSFALSETPPTR